MNLLGPRFDENAATKVVIGPKGITQYLPVLLQRQGIKQLVIRTLESGNREVACGDEAVDLRKLEELLMSFGCFTILSQADTTQK